MYKSNLGDAFRNKFSEDIFVHKYRHEGAWTWSELSHTLVEDVCRDNLSQEDKSELKYYISSMKFIPGGRYLYYSGRVKKYFNNCLAGNTKFLTREGLKTLEETCGKQVEVMSPVSGQFEKAEVRHFGNQQLFDITFSNIRGKSNKVWTLSATKEHRWPLVTGEITSALQVGDVVASSNFKIRPSIEGIRHGMIFADGNVHVLKTSFGHQLRLCGQKNKYLNYFDSDEYAITYPEFANGDPVIYINSDRNLKEIPTLVDHLDYIAGFITGWSMLDGHFGVVNQLHSINKEAIDFFVNYSFLIGYIVSGELKFTDTPSNFGERKTLYWVNFSKDNQFSGFKVCSITSKGFDDVYCVIEPKHHQFTLGYGISTGNCFLLNALEDSREDWADLSWKSESCLTTGGGIGSCYSIYRPRNSVLHGTGGQASGPISKMKMINEIGREVMQGGSRRSAIYASLHHWHPDIQEFLNAKNWHNMPVAGTDKTFADIRKNDFNFPCPLDMTNISVNYDTSWLMNYWSTGDVGSIFKQNCMQAMKTGEPGFSFNFFHKENEFLKNACTEVTSSDDSDCCNLGSINFSRIENIEELKGVVELATKFLMCGTLVADLPYPKVAEVREKNRRLGLGLMGLHEWLIQRGYKYEVKKDLHRWLAIYCDVSRDVSSQYSAHLGISKPVANRAIAPTGSIGILASTTTGIEPIYAIAVKRRYLKGTTWKYQYVVDGTAQSLIERYAIAPDGLESSVDLAKDYRKRIKFQCDVQDYVDMGISSTINLPAWGTEYNNEDKVEEFTNTLAEFCHRLRGFTCYPDGSRGGQPLVSVPYSEAVAKLGVELEENTENFDICELSGKGGHCGT